MPPTPNEMSWMERTQIDNILTAFFGQAVTVISMRNVVTTEVAAAQLLQALRTVYFGSAT